ncbi:MAG: ATP-binding protein [Treponema sp.]|nr:ATP-binding protein [Treponema sp.]
MSEIKAKTVGEIIGHPIQEEKEYTCEEHGVYRAIPTVLFGREFDANCPECMRIAEEEKEEEDAKREETLRKSREEEKRREYEEYLTEMNIGKKFWNESFETFDAYTPTLKRFKDVCLAFANDPQGRMLLMIGKNGNGKNHLATSILKKTGGNIYSVFEIELMLKECYSGKTGEPELYRRLCTIPVLIINEIGRHKVGEWETNFLSYIVNKRYENLMPTVLITNAHLKDSCPNKEKGCPDCFQNLMGNDVLSRIVENGEIMLFNEPDYRYKKREMRQKK